MSCRKITGLVLLYATLIIVKIDMKTKQHKTFTGHLIKKISALPNDNLNVSGNRNWIHQDILQERLKA